MFEMYTFSYSIAAACSKVVQINVMYLLLLRILEEQRGYHILKNVVSALHNEITKKQIWLRKLMFKVLICL